MSHKISADSRGLKIPVENGTAIRLTGDRVFTRTPAWHTLGTQKEGGLILIDRDEEWRESAYTYIDAGVFTDDNGNTYEFDTEDEARKFLANGGKVIFDLDTALQPIMIEAGGEQIMTEYAMIVNNLNRRQLVGEADDARWIPDPTIIKPVRTGITSTEEWLEHNPDGEPYTRSPRYEVITPRKLFSMMDEILQKETGMKMKAHSAGALGKDGSLGVFASVPLPRWHGDVMRAIGTDVESYMTFYNDPGGTMYVVETDILVVCYNTMIAALDNATRRLKVDHQLGAEDRMREALEGIWQANKEGQQMVQDITMFLRDQPLEDEQARLAAQAMFPLPGVPDRELVGVRSFDARYADYKRNVERALAMRNAFMELYNDPRRAKAELGVEVGIAPDVEGTGFAAMQTATFLASYYPGKDDNVMRDWFKGERLRSSNAAINAIMGGGQLETGDYDTPEPVKVPVNGVGFPQSVLDAYSEDFEKAQAGDRRWSPLQTNL